MTRWTLQDDNPLVREAVARTLAHTDGPVLPAEVGTDASREAGWRLVGVHGLLGVPHCPLRRAGLSLSPAAAPPAVLYVMGDPLAAELHRLHGCADLACVFWPGEGGGRLEPLAWPGRLESAGLTPREADVLALLLARRTNEEIAAHLVLSLSTVRAHCRAILRKMNARDRRHLWALLPPVSRW